MISKYEAKISGTGHYVPKKVLNNFDLEKIVDTSDEWIKTRTGMVERRVAAENEAVSDMAYEATLQALEMAGMRPKDIDMIIVGTISGDHPFPSTACVLQKRLGIKNFPAFDVSAGCTGWIYAANIAKQYVENGIAKNVLVIGAETLTKITNYQDRNTCVLFGDGAGATIISRAEKKDISRFIDSEITADGSSYELLIQNAGGSRMPASHETVDKNLHTVYMEGNKIFKLAIRSMYSVCDTVLKRNNMDVKSIDWLITHQANLRMFQAIAKTLNIPMERFYITIHKYGNSSSASCAIALDEAVRDGSIKKGQLICMPVFGGGLTWGSALIRW